jgi:DNA-binding Xre family transcriptional regulator
MDGEDRQARRDLRGQPDARPEDRALPGEDPAEPGEDRSEPGEDPPEPLPLLPGFREIALRRMAAQRRRLVTELTAERQAARLSQTEVAARMGTSQSAVARLESGEADARASTLERYAAAVGHQIAWELGSSGPGARRGEAPGDGRASS